MAIFIIHIIGLVSSITASESKKGYQMADPENNQVFYIARKLKPYLNSELQNRLAALLDESEGIGNTGEKIIDLLSEDEFARNWMWQALFGSQEETLSKNYTSPAGDAGPISTSSIWVCPKCDFDFRIAKSGQPVPPC
ncbi:MAG: hypothetical protein JNM00_06410, partial [Flavobacteriales bacterium]|nr:hypothetical protein [Flavobacteriales bacterium]